jgi:putative transposase
MKKSRYSTEQIVGILGESQAGVPLKEIVRKYGISEQTYYRWKSKYGGMAVGDAKRLKELETENSRLKTMLADSLLDAKVLKDLLSRKW